MINVPIRGVLSYNKENILEFKDIPETSILQLWVHEGERYNMLPIAGKKKS